MFRGKIAVITGGANSIGKCIADGMTKQMIDPRETKGCFFVLREMIDRKQRSEVLENEQNVIWSYELTKSADGMIYWVSDTMKILND